VYFSKFCCCAKWIVDLELRNIIDKLANFVARNGPEFEQMTKQKQKDNPKFSFLFAGEYYNYYQYRVTTEQAGQFLMYNVSRHNWVKCIKLYMWNLGITLVRELGWPEFSSCCHGTLYYVQCSCSSLYRLPHFINCPTYITLHYNSSYCISLIVIFHI